MKFMLLIYGDERVWTSMRPDEMEKIYAEHRAYGAEMERAGVARGGFELKPVSAAKSVRFWKGRRTVTDGPFAETKEQLAGYYLIEVDSAEQALDWAERMPGMVEGTVEIRPVAD